MAILHPEIVLLDIQLPDLGLAVAERLAAGQDAPAVVLISSRDAAAYGPRLNEARARGFIPKSGLSGEALAALSAERNDAAAWPGGWPGSCSASLPSGSGSGGTIRAAGSLIWAVGWTLIGCGSSAGSATESRTGP